MIFSTKYFMNPSILLLVLARLAIGSPQPAAGELELTDVNHKYIPPNPAKLAKATQGKNVTILQGDIIHANILQAMDDEYILHSDDLHDYFVKNDGANHTIYVKNTRVFIDMASVKLVPDKKRQYTSPCYGYEAYWAPQIQHWWDSWTPASSCLYTGNSPSGGSYGLGWAYSKSISTNAGLSLSIIKDVLSVTSGVDVTETWTHSGSITCIIPGHSVGQIWLQNFLVWGWMWSKSCFNCSYGGYCNNERARGGALAPAASYNNNGANYGCSTGYNKVRC